MEFNDGKPRRVLVLDAKYRANRRFGGAFVNPGLPTYPKHPGTNDIVIYLNPNDMINGKTTTNGAATITDDWINTNVTKDVNTAKYNCDKWMEYNDHDNTTVDYGGGRGVPAVAYCRSILVNGIPCDLPNIQTLVRIYCDAELIDSMDSTITEYPKYILGSSNPQGVWDIGIAGSGSGGNTTYTYTNSSFSSTMYSTYNTLNVYADGAARTNVRYTECSVIPILEL